MAIDTLPRTLECKIQDYDASQYVTEKPLFIWSVNLKAVKWNGTVVLTEEAEAGVEGDVALQSGDS